jgi:hypothetical protein
MIGTKVAQSLLHSVLNCCKIAITLIFLGPTENSVPINQHPCGTLIADLVDALSLLASTSQSKDWKSLPGPVVECIKVLGVRVAKESGF